MKFVYLLALGGMLGCSVRPYACGPVMAQDQIRKSFQPIIDYIGLKPGDSFADVGASSGYYTVMMSTLVRGVTFYIEDIDTSCLNAREFSKITRYYSKQAAVNVETANTFHLVLGNFFSTHLPENSLDKIYTNATFHVFQDPAQIVKDLGNKLKANGILCIRDDFAEEGKVKYCEDPKCGNPMVTVDAFLKIMKENNFILISKSDFGGYPIYKFVKGRY